MAEFILSPDAENDLTEIWTYIAEDNLDAADALLAQLEHAIHQLADMPGMGHSRIEGDVRNPVICFSFWTIFQF